MRSFEVWSEGYRATGDSSPAKMHGVFIGNTFKEAVEAFRESLADQRDRDCINLERMTFWGCRFFEDEQSARAMFG